MENEYEKHKAKERLKKKKRRTVKNQDLRVRLMVSNTNTPPGASTRPTSANARGKSAVAWLLITLFSLLSSSPPLLLFSSLLSSPPLLSSYQYAPSPRPSSQNQRCLAESSCLHNTTTTQVNNTTTSANHSAILRSADEYTKSGFKLYSSLCVCVNAAQSIQTQPILRTLTIHTTLHVDALDAMHLRLDRWPTLGILVAPIP